MTSITLRRHWLRFYVVLIVAIVFFIGISVIVGIIIYKKHLGEGLLAKDIILSLLMLPVFLMALYTPFRYFKNVPHVYADREKLQVGKEIYYWSELNALVLTGKQPFPYIITHWMEGLRLDFGQRHVLLYDEYYRDMPEFKRLVSVEIKGGVDGNFSPTSDIYENDEIAVSIFRGNFFTSMRGISAFFFVGMLAFFAVDNKHGYDTDFLHLAGICTGLFLLHGWLTHYFELSSRTLAVKNHIFFWKNKRFLLQNVKEVVFETHGKMPNCLRIITKDFRTKLYPAGTLRDKHWLALKAHLEIQGIPVRNECI